MTDYVPFMTFTKNLEPLFTGLGSCLVKKKKKLMVIYFKQEQHKQNWYSLYVSCTTKNLLTSTELLAKHDHIVQS